MEKKEKEETGRNTDSMLREKNERREENT